MIVRGSLEHRRFLAFYVSDHRVNAVVVLNPGKELRRALPLIKARATVDSAELEDEGVDLRSLLQAHIGGDQGGVAT